MATASALEGIRVLDTSIGPAAGAATAVLADFGAEVVKIEPPRGDRFRGLVASPLWLRGKRSAVVDLSTEGGREQLRERLDGFDVIVTSGPPSRSRRFGIDADALETVAPRLVHCSLTGWGARGPYAEVPGYEALVAAKSGRFAAFARQRHGDAPGFSILPVASHVAAMGAVQGIVAALLERERTGRGARVETSLLQGMLPFDLVELLLVQLISSGKLAAIDYTFGEMPTLNYHPVRTRDGRWIQCGNLLEHLFLAFLDATGLLEEMIVEERFQASVASWDSETVEVARDKILLRLQEKTAAEWMEAFRENGNVAAEIYTTVEEAVSHRDLVSNDEIVTVADADRGAVRTIGAIAILSQTPARVGAEVPIVGEYTDGFLAESPTTREMPAPSDDRAVSPALPLSGLRVVDLSTIIAGPLATTMLADLGADVIKVEGVTGDPYRFLLPQGVMAVKTNAGKRSIALDAKSEAGAKVLRDLIAGADVVLHNFRLGVDERLGIGYEACRDLNPRVVWIAVRGYGPAGPDATRPATHPVVGAAMSGAGRQGAAALTQPCESLEEVREVSRQLMRANEANPDPNTSSTAAAATLIALFARERTGLGQRVDVSMLVANAWANADEFVDYEGRPAPRQLDEEVLGVAPGYRLYRTSDGWICLAVTTDAEWERLADLLEDEALRDESQRAADGIAARFSEQNTAHWVETLGAASLGCVDATIPASGAFWANDSHARGNHFTVETEHTRFGKTLRWGSIVHVNGPAAHYGPGPIGGDSTDEILRELGRSEEEIQTLRTAGVVTSLEV